MLADLAGYVAWLARAPYAAGEASKPKAVAAHSWVDFWAARLSDKARVRSHALMLPSKEMLLAPPLLLLGLRLVQLALIPVDRFANLQHCVVLPALNPLMAVYHVMALLLLARA